MIDTLRSIPQRINPVNSRFHERWLEPDIQAPRLSHSPLRWNSVRLTVFNTFFAALISRSWITLHFGHLHSLTDRSSSSSL